MSDAPVSSSAHARKVQILVWSGTASITVVQTLLALIAYLKLEGGSTVVPGLDRWQVMYAGHVLISLTCLLLLIPVLRGPRPSLSILIVFLGLIPTWPQVAAYVSATVIGMRKGAKAIPVVVAAVIMGVAMSPLLNPIREEAMLSAVASYAVSSLPICIVCVMLGVNLQAREELLRSASREARLIRTTQEARIAQSRAEERARISREMHDSLAHRLSLISLHAGALQTGTDLDMGSVRRIAGSIHTLAADSGRELRQILAVLHDDGSADGARATWSDVEDVLSWEREAGQQIDLHLAESWADSFEAADARSRHAVLRTIEELLTNAPSGPILTEDWTYTPHRFGVAVTEAPRGEDVHWAMVGDNQKCYRWRAKAATYSNWPVLRSMFRGNTVSDAALIVGSLDPCYSCTDRVTVVDVKKQTSKVLTKSDLEFYCRDRAHSPLKD